MIMEMIMNPTKTDFRKALKGRKATVPMAGADLKVAITHSQALYIWDMWQGNIWWLMDDRRIHIEVDGDDRLGYMGAL